MKALTRTQFSMRFSVVLSVSVLMALGSAAGQEKITPRGIYDSGKFVILFADAIHDVCDPDTPPAPAQLLISTDNGKSWQKRGPEIEGSVFDEVFEEERGVWVTGEHVMEGPAGESFLMVPNGLTIDWNKSVIFSGESELQRVRFKKGRIVAWVSHLVLGYSDWTGPIIEHMSEDGGRHWKEMGPAPTVPPAGKDDSRPIGEEDKNWRIAGLDNGVAVQHRNNTLELWQDIYFFPTVTCDPERLSGGPNSAAADE